MTMRLFRLDSSIRVEGSVTRELADVVEQEWRRLEPEADVTHRDLGLEPLPPVWPAAASRFLASPDIACEGATTIAAQLVDELLEADAYVLAVPMYNFAVPQQVKHWIDLIITDPRADDVSTPLLPGRPALLVEARGGGYAPGTPRAGWNHSTPYLERILRDVWGLDVVVVSAELTAAAHDPGMADLRRVADDSRATARRDAAHHAGRIVRSFTAAPRAGQRWVEATRGS